MFLNIWSSTFQLPPPCDKSLSECSILLLFLLIFLFQANTILSSSVVSFIIAIEYTQEVLSDNYVVAGPAGATLASRLARSAAHPSVLLIEAGGPNSAKSITISAERWLHRFNPDQNWGYKTVPQENLDGLVVGYDRGKGIGGSSSINFCK